jgi:thioredoxin reductase (NADPH)
VPGQRHPARGRRAQRPDAFIKLNAELARKWPSITKRKAALPDADDWKDARTSCPADPLNDHEPKLNPKCRHRPQPSALIETDAVIVGAGPVGLFQVFELGLLEIKAHIIDSLAYPGGQCIELYPDKPIYDIPAVPVCTGKELTDNLLKQIEPFGATFHLGQEVTEVQQAGRRPLLREPPAKGTQFLTKTVFIAGGVGSFQPRTLKVDGLEKFDGSQLHYRVRNPAQFAGKNLVIVGGGDSALDWALNFVQDGPHKAESVILLHRRDGFRAAPASVAKMKRAVRGLRDAVHGRPGHRLRRERDGRSRA